MYLNNYQHLKNKETYLLFFLFLFSFLIRIPVIFIFGDTRLDNEWGIIVNNLTDYGKFSLVNFGDFFVPSLFMPPLYAFYLYFFKIFHFNNEIYIQVVLFSQIILSSFSVVIFYNINKLFFSNKICILGTLIFSLFPLHIYACTQISSIILQSFFTITFLYFFLKTVKEDPLLDKGWIAITDFYTKKMDYQNALYYINKAINIDGENVLYWKRYAKINNRLKFYEEAERGYRKTLELGNYELDTWLTRCDILIYLGEYEAAVTNLFEAIEFYPESPQIEFRLAGLYFSLNQDEKGYFHLENALRLEPDYDIILEELFPFVYAKRSVLKKIKKAKKS